MELINKGICYRCFKSIIQSYIDILIELGLKPISVDIPANSAAKFFNREIMVSESETWFKRQRSSKLSQNTFAVIDFGSETTIVNILRNRVLEFNKVILRGSSNIDEAIAASTGKKLEEAERIKRFTDLLLLISMPMKNRRKFTTVSNPLLTI